MRPRDPERPILDDSFHEDPPELVEFEFSEEVYLYRLAEAAAERSFVAMDMDPTTVEMAEECSRNGELHRAIALRVADAHDRERLYEEMWNLLAEENQRRLEELVEFEEKRWGYDEEDRSLPLWDRKNFSDGIDDRNRGVHKHMRKLQKADRPLRRAARDLRDYLRH